MFKRPNNYPYCIVCGYDNKSYFPYGVEGDAPTYAYCTQCDVEWGYSDSTIEGALLYREHYLSKLNGKELAIARQLLANIKDLQLETKKSI